MPAPVYSWDKNYTRDLIMKLEQCALSQGRCFYCQCRLDPSLPIGRGSHVRHCRDKAFPTGLEHLPVIE